MVQSPPRTFSPQSRGYMSPPSAQIGFSNFHPLHPSVIAQVQKNSANVISNNSTPPAQQCSNPATIVPISATLFSNNSFSPQIFQNTNLGNFPPNLPQPSVASPPPLMSPPIQIAALSHMLLKDTLKNATRKHLEHSSVSSQMLNAITNFTKSTQQTFRSQTTSSSQSTQNIEEALTQSSNYTQSQQDRLSFHTAGISSPPATFSPKTQRRAPCSPLFVIPPLPKTVFPSNRMESPKTVFSPSPLGSTMAPTPRKAMSPLSNETPPLSPKINDAHQHPFSPVAQGNLVNHQNSNMHSAFPPRPINSSTSIYYTPNQVCSPVQSFQLEQSKEQISCSKEVNPQILTQKLEELKQSQIDPQYSSCNPEDENRASPHEGEPLTVEEYKQRQLQKLIQEKVRLEELMMIAKRRQSISENQKYPPSDYKIYMLKPDTAAAEQNYFEFSSATNHPDQFLLPQETDFNLPEAQKQVHTQETQSFQEVTPIINKKLSISCSALDPKHLALRQEEEEEALRKENYIRDEKIRKMQERRYEEKLKREIKHSGTEASDSDTMRSRRKKREIRFRDRSCPAIGRRNPKETPRRNDQPTGVESGKTVSPDQMKTTEEKQIDSIVNSAVQTKKVEKNLLYQFSTNRNFTNTTTSCDTEKIGERSRVIESLKRDQKTLGDKFEKMQKETMHRQQIIQEEIRIEMNKLQKLSTLEVAVGKEYKARLQNDNENDDRIRSHDTTKHDLSTRPKDANRQIVQSREHEKSRQEHLTRQVSNLTHEEKVRLEEKYIRQVQNMTNLEQTDKYEEQRHEEKFKLEQTINVEALTGPDRQHSRKMQQEENAKIKQDEHFLKQESSRQQQMAKQDEQERARQKQMAIQIEQENFRQEQMVMQIEQERVRKEQNAKQAEQKRARQEQMAKHFEQEKVKQEQMDQQVEQERARQEQMAEQVEQDRARQEQMANQIEQERVMQKQMAKQVEQERVIQEQISKQVEQERVRKEQLNKQVEQEKLRQEQMARQVEQEKVRQEQMANKIEQERIRQAQTAMGKDQFAQQEQMKRQMTQMRQQDWTMQEHLVLQHQENVEQTKQQGMEIQEQMARVSEQTRQQEWTGRHEQIAMQEENSLQQKDARHEELSRQYENARQEQILHVHMAWQHKESGQKMEFVVKNDEQTQVSAEQLLKQQKSKKEELKDQVEWSRQPKKLSKFRKNKTQGEIAILENLKSSTNGEQSKQQTSAARAELNRDLSLKQKKASNQQMLVRPESLFRKNNFPEANGERVDHQELVSLDEGKRREAFRIEERRILQKILDEEEKKLLEQKRRLEEKKRRKNSSPKIGEHNENTNRELVGRHRRLPGMGRQNLQYGVGGISIAEQLLLDEKKMLEENWQMQLQEEQDEEEARLEDLRRQEKEKMKEEARIYEEYQLHLEAKHKNQLYDSDDYASEWETGEDDEGDKGLRVVNVGEEEEEEEEFKEDKGPYLEERFDELKATSEEELFEAQEKSIRNLERQIRKQKQNEMKRNIQNRHQANKKHRNKTETSEGSSKMRAYSSTGDLNAVRKRPITQFSPDPMEFGFKPIESPDTKLSKSTGNLITGGGPSVSSIVHVAGAEAGVAAGRRPLFQRRASEDLRLSEDWNSSHIRMSSSLEDLQQVSRKPPIPSKSRTKLRHAASEETLTKTNKCLPVSPKIRSSSVSEDPRRHTYSEGEDFSELSNLEAADLEECDYSVLLNEYYAAYYQAYYESYYRKQRSETIKEGKMNYGPPPPPPPPPFQTGAPPVRLPSEIAAAAASANKSYMASPPLMMAPPAALAGAMLKDKKPFTYTPGGLNLAEIKSPRMQRRLQRNASLEGVKPSPLAQQPTPSSGGSHTGGISPVIPPHGMIQVLPMPGMGMAPMTKPQSQKEAPKVKRNVCGPPPPPPPFCISGEISIEPSPSSTPYATPKEVTPCITSSSTPPSTPGIYSTPSTSSTPPICNGPESDFKTSLVNEDLQPTMASEPGPSPSIPPPPPLPPSNSNRKNFSVPFPSPPKAPAAQLPPETVLSPSSQQPPPKAANIPVAKFDPQPTKSPELIQDSMSDTNTSSSSMSISQKHDSSHAASTSFSERDESSSDLSKTSDSDKLEANEIRRHKVEKVKEIELNYSSDTSSNQTKPAASKIENNELQTPVETTSSSMQQQTIPSTAQQQEQQKQIQYQNKPINSCKEINENRNVKQEVLPPVSQSTINKNAPQESRMTQKLRPTQTADHSEEVTVGNNYEKLSKESQNFQPHWRMASPPPQNIVKETCDVPNSRMVRQASLPAQPFYPPISPPTVIVGSLYIPPVPVQITGTDCSLAQPNQRPENLSPTSGLAKAPLPWMFAAKKEASPPPEFLVQAQKTQQRLQRQRSFPQQETKQPYQQQNDQQRLYDPSQDLNYVNSFNSYPVSEVRILPPPAVFNNVDHNSGSQHTWQSPSQQPTYPPLIKTIQQFSQNAVPSQSQQQPRFAPKVNHFNEVAPQSKHPRERIIPIMMEDSPPVSPTVGGPSNHFIPNNFAASPLSKPNYRPEQSHEPQRQPSNWPNSRGVLPPPPTIPPSSTTLNCHNKDEISPVEALQQMQQNLAHLNTSFKTGQVEQNGTSVMPSQFRGPNDMPIQSRSFKVIQNAYDGSPDPIVDDPGSLRVLDWTIRGNPDNLKELLKPKAPIRKVALNSSSPSVSKQPEGGQSVPKRTAFIEALQVMTNTLPENGSVSQEELQDHHQPEPRKYAGSSIPSRSFRMLQTMTDTEEGPGPGQSDL